MAMDPVVSAYAAVLCFSALVAAGTGFHVWRDRDRPGADWFVVAVGGVTLWTGSQFVGTLQAGLDGSLLWFKLTYVGAVVVVAALFLFTLSYTGRAHLIDRRLLAVLAVEPVVVVALVFVGHDLFHPLVTLDPRIENMLNPRYGVGFYLHLAYSSVLLAVSSALLVETLYRARRVYRGQAFALLVAIFLPWAGSIYDGFADPTLTLAEPAFAVTVVALWIALFRYDLIELSPIARATVLDALSEGVVVVDARGRVTDVNPAAERLLGVGESVVGAQATAAFDTYPELATAAERGEAPAAAVTVESAGQPRHLEVETTAFGDAASGPTGRVFLLQDVTARIERERELEHQNDRLDRFAGVVSHDLRNPLNVAQGYTDLVEPHVDDDGRAFVAQVQSSHDRMERIVENVLTLSREGHAVTDPVPVDIGILARDAWSHVATGDATLDVQTDRTVTGDRDRLLQVFENLFRNAVEHGSTSTQQAGNSVEHGSEAPDISVRVGSLPDGFFVEDDGPGIPEHERDVVLESGHSGGGGTGLGLAIVAEAIDAHGWELVVTESDDGGARFEVTSVE
ncbi:histidine kinase N-terminal 7TM domain-containing protein [Haloarchaeobius sp. DFWS5]|uniref:histidine kinase N-terminal 7TM domain-containing protein n=1 Tax=Haloarchaeobius sp. DFWS5 TaxID=3446114 RepID=UPI003EBBC82E